MKNLYQSRRNSMGATSTSTEDSEPVGDVISTQPSSVEHLDDDLRRLPGAQPVRQVIIYDCFEYEDLKFLHEISKLTPQELALVSIRSQNVWIVPHLSIVGVRKRPNITCSRSAMSNSIFTCATNDANE